MAVNLLSLHPAASYARVCSSSRALCIRAATPSAATSNGSSPSAGNPLFQPLQVAGKQLKHRIVLAPLTRDRAVGSIPQPNMVTYYKQRASDGGLMITEGTIVSPMGYGYFDVPGIHTKEQVEGWKAVTDAVHDKGAVMFNQIWHCGRACLPEFLPGGAQPIGPSAIPVTENMGFSIKEMGFVPYPRPRALDINEIPGIVDEYRIGAWNATQAGFDGVEIHGANGYLIDQFLKTAANKRTDMYGGCIENRCRFALEVVDAVTDQIGADKVGIRLSPFGGFLNGNDEHPYALTSYLLEELNKRKLAYVHFVEPVVAGNATKESTPDSLAPFRSIWKGVLIAAGGYTRQTAMAAVATGHCDLVAFGRSFIANPDLPKRLLQDAALNAPDPAKFYTPGDQGYIDYPMMEELQNA